MLADIVLNESTLVLILIVLLIIAVVVWLVRNLR
jgi:hypothetical protein